MDIMRRSNILTTFGSERVKLIKRKDFRYMKIHMFSLRWKDEIKGSSQLRTLLKRVVVNRL